MASRHERSESVGPYVPFHVTTLAANPMPVGLGVATTSGSTITAGSNVVCTPVSMSNITPGMILNIANGTGTAEDIIVGQITATTFTIPTLVNTHSGAYTITSRRGHYFGRIVVNKAGSGDLIFTLYNGSPNVKPVLGYPYGIFAVIPNPVIAGQFFYDCALDSGLFYTLTGTTAGDYTFTIVDMPI